MLLACKLSRSLLKLLLLSWFVSSPYLSRAQWLSLQNRKRESIEFKSVKNLIIIPLHINGKGPFNFVLDTGVGLLLITDPALKDSLAIPTLRKLRITGFGEGEELTAYVTPSINIAIGHNISGDISAAILKKDAFNLSNYAGMPIHGLLGYEFFNSFIVRINYGMNMLTVYRHEVAFIPKKGYKVPITIEEHKPYVNSEVCISPGKTVLAKLIIDTGAGHPLSLETDNGKPFELTEKHIPANLGVGLNGNIKGFVGRVPWMKLGKYQLRNVIAAFPDYNDAAAKMSSINRNGNIGNSILKRFDVVFDYNRETMYLRPSLKYKEPFEHDMSGMELIAAGDDLSRILIARVEKYSAADEIGLSDGDEILAINFKPVRDMTLEDIDGIFHSREGRGLILRVLLKGESEPEQVILTLKRRI